MVVLGANGAGKTTTLRAISGMIRVKGSIIFDGSRSPASRPRPWPAPASPTCPRAAARSATSPSTRTCGSAPSTARTARSAPTSTAGTTVFPRLGERRDQAAGSMSGGEQQMLAIARAMMSRPRLLLLDEPSLGLAPLVTRELFDRLGELNREEGLTMLVVEQNANLALDIGHRGYVLETGRIVGRGTPPTSSTTTRPSARRTWGSDMDLFVSQLFNGIGNGVVYASVALALVLIFRTTGLLNFAQGEMALFSTYLSWKFTTKGMPVVAGDRPVDGHLLRRRRDHRAGADPAGRDGPQPAQRGDRDARHVPRHQLARPAVLRDRPAGDAVAVPRRGP